jgi:hypothetical protein
VIATTNTNGRKEVISWIIFLQLLMAGTPMAFRVVCNEIILSINVDEKFTEVASYSKMWWN